MKKKDFDFLDLSKNDDLDKLNKDKDEFVKDLDNLLLSLREKLSFSSNDTFGFEIEFERSNRKIMETSLREFIDPKKSLVVDKKWELKDEVDELHRYAKGKLELSSPILTDTKKTWILTDFACNTIKTRGRIGQDCGGHINVGAHILGNSSNYWLNFLNIWSAYEDIIYRFLYGEYVTGRFSIDGWAKPMSYDFRTAYSKFNKYKNLDYMDILYYFNDYIAKSCGVNLTRVTSDKIKKGNTIEFRCPNGSLNATIWQNNLNFILSLLNYCKSDNFDREKIENKKKRSNPMVMGDYNDIDIDSAIELSNMIFNNNLDKCYFLRQYFKSMKIDSKPLVRAKQFTKS